MIDMTIDDERFRAIGYVREYLRRLFFQRPMKIKVSELRQDFYRLLKHYPEEWFVKRLEDMYFDRDKKEKSG